MTRRHFLQAATSAVLSMGLGGLFSSHHAAAHMREIKYLRQIVTHDPQTTRMIQWDSVNLLPDVRVEVRPAGTHPHIDIYIPSYTYFDIDDAPQYTYHAEIRVPRGGGDYRVTSAHGTSAWIPIAQPDRNGTVRALLFSDSQCGESYDVWRGLYHAAWRRHPHADFAALVGDLVDNGESSWHWESFLSAMGGADSPLARHIHAPALGNHEYYGLSWTAVPPARYLHTFALPDNGSTAFPGHYYSFTMGVVHFMVLDTQFLELDARGSLLKTEQLAWLIRDAAESHAPWRVVLMHKDILACGDYQTEQGTTAGISDVGRVFMDTFDALDIDLVVSGHIHTYRRRQIRAQKTDPNGTLYLLAGPAGNEYFDVPAESYDLAASANSAPSNYLYMEADAKELHVSCETADGTVIDTVTLRKSKPPA